MKKETGLKKMKIKKILIVLLLSVLLISCTSKRKDIQFNLSNNGTLDIKLDSFESCNTNEELQYLLYSPMQQQNYDIIKFDKITGIKYPVNRTLYDEYSPVGIDDDTYCFISNEYDIKGNIVIKEDGKRFIVGTIGEREYQIDISPDKKFMAFISQRDNKYINVYDFLTKKIIHKEKMKIDSLSFYDNENIIFSVENKIYKYNIKNKEISILVSGLSLKYNINYIKEENAIYYTSIPFDTNHDNKLDENDEKFIAKYSRGREILLKNIDSIKNFGIDEKYLYFVDKNSLRYQLKDYSIPDFSSVYHYYEYLKKLNNINRKLTINRYLFSIRDKFEEYEDIIVLNFFKFLKNNNFKLNLNYYINYVFKNYEQDSKIFYIAELFDKNIYMKKNYINIYNEYRIDYLYEKREFNLLISFIEESKTDILPKKTYNKFQFYLAESYYKTDNFEKAIKIIVNLTESNIDYDIWIEKDVSLFLKIYNYNQISIIELKSLSKKYKNNNFLFNALQIKISDMYIKNKKQKKGLDLLREIFNEESNNNRVQTNTAIRLSEAYLEVDKIVSGVSFVTNYLRENEYPVNRSYFLNYIKNNGLYLAEKFYNEDDLLRAKKWLQIILNYLPANIEANRKFIKIAFEMENIDEVAGKYKQMLQENKNDAYFNYFFGYAMTYIGTKYSYQNETKFERAAYVDSLFYINKTIKLNPTEPYFYLTRGWLYEKLNQFNGNDNYLKDALNNYKKGLALTEDTTLKEYFFRNIGNTYYKMNLYERSYSFYNRLDLESIKWSMESEKISFYLKLSDLYYQLNYFKKAIELDERILNYYSNKNNYKSIVNTNNHMGLMYNQLENYLKAADIFENNLNLIEKYNIDYDKVKIYRNIAYNSLKAEDDIRAIESSRMGLEILKDRVQKKRKKGFLDISLIVGLKSETTQAYKGFTPEMERNIFYSILATAHGRLGNWNENIDYYKEKLKISDNEYANFIITNNLYNIFYELDKRDMMEEFLKRSKTITEKNKILRGNLVNYLNSVLLKENINKNDINRLIDLQKSIQKIKDEELINYYMIVFNFAAENVLDSEVSFESIEESINRIELEINIFNKIRENLKRLKENINDSKSKKYIQRLEYLYEYKYTGSDAENNLLGLIGDDTFLNLLIRNDLVNISIYNNNFKQAQMYFVDLIDAMGNIGPTDFKKLALFYRYNRNEMIDNLVKLIKNGYRDNLFYCLSGIENIQRYIIYERFKPPIISQMDTIYLNNYFYELEFDRFDEARKYLNKMDSRTRFFIGKYNINDRDVLSILSDNKKVVYNLNDRYLILEDGDIKIENEFQEADIIIDNKGATFISGSKNFYTINQMVISHENSFIKQNYEEGSLSELTDLEKSYLKIEDVNFDKNNPINPFNFKLQSTNIMDLIDEDINLIGLWISTKSEFSSWPSLRNLIDTLMYINISDIKVGEYSFSFNIFENIKDDKLIENEIDKYNRNAYLYFQNQKYKKAFLEMKKAIYLIKNKTNQNDLSKKLVVLINIGANYLNNPEIIKNYLKEYIELKGLEEIDYLKRMALLYEKNGYYRRAFEIYKEIEDKYNEKDSYRMGILNEKMGEIAKALEYLEKADTERADLEISKILYKYLNRYDEALDILKKLKSEKLKSEASLIRAFIHLKSGDRNKAIEILSLIEDESKKELNSIVLNTLVGKAHIYFQDNNYLKSIKSIKDTFNKIPDEKFHEERVILGNLLALNYLKLEKFSPAMSVIDEYINYSVKYGIINQLPFLKLNKNLIYIEKGEYSRAVENLKEISAEYEDKNNLMILNTINKNMGMAYFGLKDYENSQKYFRRILKNSELKDNNTIYAYIYLYRITNKKDYLDSAEELAVKNYEYPLLVNIYYFKGRIGDPVYFEKALEIMKIIIDKLKIKDTRISYFNKYRKIFSDLLKVYFEKGKKISFIKTLEEYKYLKFQIPGKDIYSLENADISEIDKIDKLREDLNFTESNGFTNDKKKIKDKLEKKIVDYYLDNIDDKNNSINDPNNDFKIDVMDDNTFYASYGWFDEYLYAAFIYNDKIFMKRIPANERKVIAENIKNINRLVSNKGNINSIKEIAKNLFDSIFNNIDRSTDKIVVSPDGILNSFSFDILHYNNSYLIDNYAISYIHSFNHYRELQNYRWDIKKIMAVGNPDIDNEDLELYFAQKEANEINFLFDDVDIYTGSKATETVFKNQILKMKYDIIHLATHSNIESFNTNDINETYLIFKKSERDDGILTENEIKMMNVNTDLIVLSACETGVGDLSDTENSLELLFRYKNVPFIISSLWRISDVHTAILFKKFYRSLHNSKSLNLALKDAKLDIKERFEHPVYWAGIKFIGL